MSFFFSGFLLLQGNKSRENKFGVAVAPSVKRRSHLVQKCPKPLSLQERQWLARNQEAVPLVRVNFDFDRAAE